MHTRKKSSNFAQNFNTAMTTSPSITVNVRFKEEDKKRSSRVLINIPCEEIVYIHTCKEPKNTATIVTTSETYSTYETFEAIKTQLIEISHSQPIENRITISHYTFDIIGKKHIVAGAFISDSSTQDDRQLVLSIPDKEPIIIALHTKEEVAGATAAKQSSCVAMASVALSVAARKWEEQQAKAIQMERELTEHTNRRIENLEKTINALSLQIAELKK